MSDPQQSQYPTIELVDPDEDELAHQDKIQFVKNGWIRGLIDGAPFKLRRPFLGELQALEQSKEGGMVDLSEESQAAMDDARNDLDLAKKIDDEARKLGTTAKDVRRKAELDSEATALAVKQMRRQQDIGRHADDFRVQWWKEVFATLTPPGSSPPEQVPSWVVDPMLMEQVVVHWRTAPLAYGS